MTDAKPSRWKRFIWWLERAAGAETGPHGSQIAEAKGIANHVRDMGNSGPGA